MNTSRTTSGFSKPHGSEKISLGVLSYFRTRNRNRAYSTLMNKFDRSGVTQSDLSHRLGMDRGQLSRLLSAPGNLTLDTISDLLFAMGGYEMDYGVSSPLDKAPRNDIAPEWVNIGTPISSSSGRRSGAETTPTKIQNGLVSA